MKKATHVEYQYAELFPVFGFELVACFDTKQLETISSDYVDTGKPLLEDGCFGMAIKTEAGGCICIDTAGLSAVELVTTIAHESTHVWQYIRDGIGEEAPSAEFEAYHIGYITGRVFEWSQDYAAKKNAQKAKAAKKAAKNGAK